MSFLDLRTMVHLASRIKRWPVRFASKARGQEVRLGLGSMSGLENRSLMVTGIISPTSLLASNAISSFEMIEPKGADQVWDSQPFENRLTGIAPERIISAAALKIPQSRVIRDIAYYRIGNHEPEIDLYFPKGLPPETGWPVIMAFPGGGWQTGDRVRIAESIRPLTQEGYIVAGVDYFYGESYNPNNRAWPAAFLDARAAVQWVRRNAAKIGADPDRIVAFGESAGGHLATMLGVYPDGKVLAEGDPLQKLRRDPTPASARVQAFVSLYGPQDIAFLYRNSPKPRPNFLALIGGKPFQFPERYRAASPVSHITPDDSPGLFIHGLKDSGVFPTESTKTANLLEDQGVFNRVLLIRKLGHSFQIRSKKYDFLPKVTDFLNQVWTIQDGGEPDQSVPRVRLVPENV